MDGGGEYGTLGSGIVCRIRLLSTMTMVVRWTQSKFYFKNATEATYEAIHNYLFAYGLKEYALGALQLFRNDESVSHMGQGTGFVGGMRLAAGSGLVLPICILLIVGRQRLFRITVRASGWAARIIKIVNRWIARCLLGNTTPCNLPVAVAVVPVSLAAPGPASIGASIGDPELEYHDSV